MGAQVGGQVVVQVGIRLEFCSPLYLPPGNSSPRTFLNLLPVLFSPFLFLFLFWVLVLF